jgi:hypothetical protein
LCEARSGPFRQIGPVPFFLRAVDRGSSLPQLPVPLRCNNGTKQHFFVKGDIPPRTATYPLDDATSQKVLTKFRFPHRSQHLYAPQRLNWPCALGNSSIPGQDHNIRAGSLRILFKNPLARQEKGLDIPAPLDDGSLGKRAVAVPCCRLAFPLVHPNGQVSWLFAGKSRFLEMNPQNLPVPERRDRAEHPRIGTAMAISIVAYFCGDSDAGVTYFVPAGPTALSCRTTSPLVMA